VAGFTQQPDEQLNPKKKVRTLNVGAAAVLQHAETLIWWCLLMSLVLCSTAGIQKGILCIVVNFYTCQLHLRVHAINT
jgi:hypothetical protein